MASEEAESMSGAGAPVDAEAAPNQLVYQAAPSAVMMPAGPRRGGKPPGYNSPNPCCCMSLRTGCYVLGALIIVTNILSLVGAALSTEGDASAKKTMVEADDANNGLTIANDIVSLIFGVIIFVAAFKLNRILALVFGVWFGISVPIWFVVAVRAFIQGKTASGVFALLLLARDAWAASIGFCLAIQIKNGEYSMMYPPAGAMMPA